VFQELPILLLQQAGQSSEPDIECVSLQLEEFKRKKAAVAAKKVEKSSTTPRITPLVTPVKGPETNSNVQTPSVTSGSARRALPAGQAKDPSKASTIAAAQKQGPLPDGSVLQQSAAGAAPARETRPAIRQADAAAPYLPPPIAQASPAHLQPQKTVKKSSGQEPYGNGANSQHPAAPSAAEQQKPPEVEAQLQERHSEAEMQRLQHALSETQEAHQAIRSNQAAAERLAESLRQELAQEQADKVKLSERLQYLEAEAQGSAQLQYTNRNLQEQVQMLILELS
jgi:hypothetical protein